MPEPSTDVEVLIIEDDRSVALVVTQMLKGPGETSFSVEWVTRLSDGIESLRRKAFDVVLLDLSLPDSHGLDTITVLQKAAPHVPILVFTGMHANELAIEAMRRGAQDCLFKGKVDMGLLRRALLYAIERKQLLDQVVQQNNRLQEMDRMKSEFVSVVTHELRTPVTAIKLSLTMLEGGHPELNHPENQESLDMMRRNVERLMKLVNEVLDVSRIESGRLPMNMGVHNLTAIIREVAELMRPQTAGRRARMSVNVPGSPLEVYCDREKIIQVLCNLANNALVHNREGLHISIGTREAQGRVVVWVKDNGGGIPESEQRRIFEPYYQALAGGDGVKKGTGLGLAIARGMLEAHGKDLVLRSKEGTGSVFCFELETPHAERFKLIETIRRRVEDIEVVLENYGVFVRALWKGGLRMGHHAGLMDAMEEAVALGEPYILIDLSKCTYLDSRTIGALVECRALATQAGGDLVLGDLSPIAREVLQRVGLLHTLPQYSDTQAGFLALRRMAKKTSTHLEAVRE